MATRKTTHILKNSDIVARPLPTTLLKGEPIINTADGIMLFSGVTQSTSGWTQSGPTGSQPSFFEVGSNLYDLKIRNFNSLALTKFGFYRSICRGINRKLLHQYELRLGEDVELCDVIESSLADCFLGLIHSSQHSYSFKKYIERVQDGGFKVPETMANKINSYLSF